MSDRLISARDLENAIQREREKCGIFSTQVEQFFTDIIRKQPTIDKDNRTTGKWDFVVRYGGTIRIFKCSICEYEQSNETSFCPNCGARMS